MGNRGGCLHDTAQRIVRPFVSRRWIACLLEFKGRRRTVMTPGRYTELFFLDEATALAAGLDVPHAVVRVLEEAGIQFVFGMPGGDTGRIFDALYDSVQAEPSAPIATGCRIFRLA